MNGAGGFVFITNQELRLAERKELSEINDSLSTDIYHLERIANYLNIPSSYGLRMEFLDIEMSKEEQLSFFAQYDKRISKIENVLEHLSVDIDSCKIVRQIEDAEDYPRSIDEISEALDEYLDKIWFDRHQMLKHLVESGKTEIQEDIWAGALEAEKSLIKNMVTRI